MGNVADKIADYLLTDGVGRTARRLVMELENGTRGGGWGKQAVRDAVQTHLDGVVTGDHSDLLAALLGVARWQMPDGPCWCENWRKKEGVNKHHFKPCADARAAIAKAKR